VKHTRFTPRKYQFGASFFWFGLDIDSIDDDFSSLPLVSRNRWNIFQFRDDDHIDFNQGNIRSNIEYFLKENDEEQKPEKITLWTNLRFLGYVFNPVSFYLLTMSDGTHRVIMEVGNTFNELKPFYVPASSFKDNKAEIRVQKHYYVSPFIALDTFFTVKFKFEDDTISIIVNSDYEDGTKVLSANLFGVYDKLSTKNLVFSIIKHPFVTLKIIGLIHWHALVLWLKKIPYISKDDNPELQQGNMVWKK
tara:strand:- start:1121 stop:1867 length:747 start_codon:yes stop_codon:yes gene_type:complete